MKIHIIGIGGIATGNLAKMLKDKGFEVSGSDKELYPPMSEKLKEWGFDVKHFSRGNIVNAQSQPLYDLYIVGNVMSRGNEEVEEVLNHNLPLMSMPQAIYEFFLKNKKTIVIAGTHGKTTTTFLTHFILKKGNIKSGLFAGGIRSDGFPGYDITDGDFFVIEGDEYDSSFFDKQPKFLHYRPYYLILTSLEYDHADIYENFNSYQRSFEILLRWIPEKGKIIANYDYEAIRRICKQNAIYYSQNNPSLSHFSFHQNHLNLNLQKKFIENIKPKIIGRYNYSNIIASALLAEHLGIDYDIIKKSIEEFPGVLRRQSLRKTIFYKDFEVQFYEDFAHHPTAIKETLKGFRESFSESFLIACYEPRSATSHRNVFQNDYPESFRDADLVHITDIFNKKKVPEKIQLNVSRIVEEMNQREYKAYFFKNPGELIQFIQNHFDFYLDKAGKNHRKKIIFLFMSNGEFGGIYPQFEDFLEKIKMS